MLELAGSAGLAIAGARFAEAQTAKRIDRFDSDLDKVISPTEPILELATGFGGGGNTEGPVWWKEGGFLLFSSIGDNRVIKYTPGEGTSVYREKTNGANGHARDPQGRLVSCEGFARRVTREEKDGSITVIANNYQGRPLNKPNDVVVKSDDSIYFTDPWNIPDLPQSWDLDFNGVYRVSPDLGTVNLLTRDLFLPNGLAFSPDEKILYIVDSRRTHIRAFDLMPNGLLALQTERVFVELKGPEPGGPDGIKVDVMGNVYTGGSGGIYVVDPKGKKLGRIVHGQPQTTNIAFGGDDWKTLYFTTHSTLGSVKLKVAGLPVPARKA
ncbi:MAG TPA: SMP-30/gluconolactonase/LRE family protein [Micropepsaceae bacterium]|nr:SMP-30/gluconolactonase/LRE family protein [Micropepsaceae bacterium]